MSNADHSISTFGIVLIEAHIYQMELILGNAHIPVEVLENIFQQLDKPSISVCSQLSHTWLEFTRPYLFRHLAYRLSPDDCYNHASRPSDIFDKLFHFLVSSPSLCRLVYSLTVALSDESQTLFSWGILRWHHNRMRTGGLTRILPLLPHLHTLQVDSIPLLSLKHVSNDSQDPRPTSILRRLSWFNRRHSASSKRESFTDRSLLSPLNLKCLKLTAERDLGYSSSRARPYDVLSLFGTVDRLFLGSFPFSSSYDVLPDSLLPLQISSLAVEDIKMLSCLLSMPSLQLPRLRVVDLPHAPEKDIQVVHNFIDIVHTNLRHLGLTVHLPSLIYSKKRMAKLTHLESLPYGSLSSLESFAFTVPLYGVSDYELSRQMCRTSRLSEYPRLFEPAYDLMLKVIPILPPSTCTIAFRLHYATVDSAFLRLDAELSYTPYVPLSSDWTRLEDILLARVEAGLQNVEFRDVIWPCLPEIERLYLKRVFPRLWNTGVVRFPRNEPF